MQAFGLRQWLRLQGVEAEFINYHPAHVEAGGIQFSRGLKGLAKSAYLMATQTKRRWLGDREQAVAFRNFQRDELGVKSAKIQTVADLNDLDPFDLIICGSDQIWNPSEQYGLDPIYFGDFPIAKKGRRISYAASFGKPILARPYHAQATKLLRNLDAIAVRERSGVDIVGELTGLEAVMTPDPTILVRDFSHLIDRYPSNHHGHVFCYALRTSEGIRDIADIAAAHTGGKVLSPDNPHRRWREIGTTVYPSPGEWLTLIDQASFVVTNSFHGVALSLLRRKPFISIALPGARGALSERVRNLLIQVGLEDRLVNAGGEAAARSAMSDPIDWEAVEVRLNAMSESGRSYLRDQLAAAGSK